jgi:hypothetical protein
MKPNNLKKINNNKCICENEPSGFNLSTSSTKPVHSNGTTRPTGPSMSFFIEIAAGPTGPVLAGPYEVTAGETIRFFSDQFDIQGSSGSVNLKIDPPEGVSFGATGN